MICHVQVVLRQTVCFVSVVYLFVVPQQKFGVVSCDDGKRGKYLCPTYNEPHEPLSLGGTENVTMMTSRVELQV